MGGNMGKADGSTGIGRLNGKNWPNSASLPIALLNIIRELLVNWPNSANFCHSNGRFL